MEDEYNFDTCNFRVLGYDVEVKDALIAEALKFIKELKAISCAYNMDTCCVELKFGDGSMIDIDTIAVENEVAKNMYQRSELDYLIYNDPVGYPACAS